MPDLQQAISVIKSGDKATGKQLLIEVLKADQHNEAAWLWMTQVVSTDAERIKCLQNVLRINPSNEAAKQGLAKFQQKQAPPKPIEPPPESKLAVVPEHVTPPVEKPKSDTKPIKPLKSFKREDTKKCPYCAETIKAEAKFCRFCGRNLDTGQLSNQPSVQYVQPQTEVHIVVEEKDPNSAGCLNLIIPGLGYVYVGNWARGIITFFVFSFLAAFLLSLVAVDGGLCSGPLLLGAIILLFVDGRSAAIRRNQRTLGEQVKYH